MVKVKFPDLGGFASIYVRFLCLSGQQFGKYLSKYEYIDVNFTVKFSLDFGFNTLLT